MMRSLPLLPLALALTACSRALIAPLVPKLDLRCDLTRAASAGSLGRADERLHASFGAVLRWQPPILAKSVLVPIELTPAAWLAPCALDDTTCLSEVLEVERELARGLESP